MEIVGWMWSTEEEKILKEELVAIKAFRSQGNALEIFEEFRSKVILEHPFLKKILHGFLLRECNDFAISSRLNHNQWH